MSVFHAALDVLIVQVQILVLFVKQTQNLILKTSVFAKTDSLWIAKINANHVTQLVRLAQAPMFVKLAPLDLSLLTPFVSRVQMTSLFKEMSA